MKWLRKIRVRLLVVFGRAVNIWSGSAYPANVLSNLYPNAFVFDGVECASMEGFLQSLKYRDRDVQRAVCALSGKEAKRKSNNEWQATQTLYWNDKPLSRGGKEFHALLECAFRALYWQSESFRSALLATRGKRLYHVQGKSNPRQTILTENEFCTILRGLLAEG